MQNNSGLDLLRNIYLEGLINIFRSLLWPLRELGAPHRKKIILFFLPGQRDVDPRPLKVLQTTLFPSISVAGGHQIVIGRLVLLSVSLIHTSVRVVVTV
jgi:hypothetical protein